MTGGPAPEINPGATSEIVMSSEDVETAAALAGIMEADIRRAGLSLRYDGGKNIIIEVPAPALDLPPATTGRLGFERAIKKARKRRRGRR